MAERARSSSRLREIVVNHPPCPKMPHYAGALLRSILISSCATLLTARTVAAIELDDRTHDQRDRRKRDVFVEQALDAANVVLIRFRAASAYVPFAIRRQIETAVARRFPHQSNSTNRQNCKR